MGLLSTIGQVAGGIFGGPLGAAAGGAIGGAIDGQGGGGGGAGGAEFQQALSMVAMQPFQDAMAEMQEAWAEDDEE
jgi:hypothetical protein